MQHVQEELEATERRACQVVGQPRSTQRYEPEPKPEETKLVKRMKQLARKHPRYGYRRIGALLRAEGWTVNRKRVHRLWRKEGHKVPVRQRKRRRLGNSGNGTQLRRATHRNEVWSYDFVMDQTADGRRLKFLPIVDEYTRECVELRVERSLTAREVVETLRQKMAERGAPKYLRSDNGPEFIAKAVREWLAEAGVSTLYIEPGSPWENAYSESFNSRLRDELLDREEFASLPEAKVLAGDYRREYNEKRPHSSLNYQTPSAFAASCVAKKISSPLGGKKDTTTTEAAA